MELSVMDMESLFLVCVRKWCVCAFDFFAQVQLMEKQLEKKGESEPLKKKGQRCMMKFLVYCGSGYY